MSPEPKPALPISWKSKALLLVGLLAPTLVWQGLGRALAAKRADDLTMFGALIALEWSLGVGAVWALLHHFDRSLGDLGFPEGRSRVALFVGCGAVTVAAALFGFLRSHDGVGSVSMLVVLAGAPTAGLVEETLYRGVGVGLGERVLGSRVTAWVIAALAFALLHLNGGLGRQAGALGFAIGMTALYRSTRSLALPIAAHWLFDVAVVTLNWR